MKWQGGDEGLVLVKVTEGLDPLVLLMLAELVAASVWGRNINPLCLYGR